MSAYKKILCSVLFFLHAFLFTSEIALAQVVINEVFPNPSGSEEENEWLELYNSSDEDIDVADYRLLDAADHELVIDQTYADGSTLIPAGGLLVVRRNSHKNFSLNNSGDETIRLYDTTQPDPIDNFSYKGSGEDLSWARIPDGGGIYSEKLEPSPGESNQLPPTPTPTPTPTPKPTATPKPTSTPKPTNTPKPTKKPTAASVSTPIPTKEPLVMGTMDVEDDILEESPGEANSEEMVVETQDFEKQDKDLQDENQNGIQNGKSEYLLPFLISLTGLVLLAIAGFPFIKGKLPFFKNKESEIENLKKL